MAKVEVSNPDRPNKGRIHERESGAAGQARNSASVFVNWFTWRPGAGSAAAEAGPPGQSTAFAPRPSGALCSDRDISQTIIASLGRDPDVPTAHLFSIVYSAHF